MEVISMFLTTKSQSKIKAMATVNINGLLISDVKVVEGKTGLFVGLPSRVYEKDGESKWIDIVKFADEENRNAFVQVVLNAFYSKRAEAGIAPDGNKVYKTKAEPPTSSAAPAIRSDNDWFDQSGEKKNEGWGDGW